VKIVQPPASVPKPWDDPNWLENDEREDGRMSAERALESFRQDAVEVFKALVEEFARCRVYWWTGNCFDTMIDFFTTFREWAGAGYGNVGYSVYCQGRDADRTP
jgi:hypothetical protein